jgi:hypothetical protein
MQYAAEILASFAMPSLTPASVVPVWAADNATAQLKDRLDGITHYGAIASLQRVLTDLYNQVLVPLLYNSSAGPLMSSRTEQGPSTITTVSLLTTLPTLHINSSSWY